MVWIGLVVGVVIGALIGELPGAIVLGFVGWLVGLIISSIRKPKSTPMSVNSGMPAHAAPATPRTGTLEERVLLLEAALARVEARLRQLDGGFAAETGETGARPGPGPGLAPLWPGPGPGQAPVLPVVEAEVPPAKPEPEIPVSEPAPPPPPPLPSEPNFIVAWFTGGNAIARVGVVILFFGLAFLLKYAADNNMLPPELRVGAVALFGIGMLGLGWKLREKREAFAIGLQGAAVAVLYLVTFAALRLYNLIPPELAFFMLAAIAVFAAILSIAQDAVALAVIGAGGGFLAPILASTGGGSHVMLFSYYLVLNLGIAVIAYFKAWRSLNLTGFLFTFFIGLAWGMQFYRPEHFDTTEPFLIAFWLIYVAIAVLVARESPETGVRPGSDPGFRKRYVDGTITFGVPLGAFALQAALLHDSEYGLAFSSLAAAAVYLGLAMGLLSSRGESWNLLAQSFLALGVVFVTLAIPLALDARWTSASWALEGAAIFWIGVRQRRRLARAFAVFLQFAAGVAFVEGYRRLPGGYPLVDAAFIGAMLIAIAGIWTNRLIERAGDAVSKFEQWFAGPIFAWGFFWLLFAGVDEIHAHVPRPYTLPAALMWFSAVTLLFGHLANRWTWNAAAWATRALLPLMILGAVAGFADGRHPFGSLGWIAWPLAFVVHGWTLRKIEPERRGGLVSFLHVGGVLLLAFVGAMELHWVAQTYTARHTAWSLASLVVVPAALMLIASSKSMDERWPVNDHVMDYRYRAALILALGFALWSLFGNLTHDASSDPLPYLPLLNAVDLAHGLVIVALASAWMALRRSDLAPPEFLEGRGGLVVLGGLTFIWLNAILLRTLSHWAAIPYRPDALVRSVLVQASLSVFWSVLALTAMVYATRTARRVLWMIGMGLMVVVVAKLFLVDLSNVGGIERIVSFIAVGVLMLVIGYFSPVPPRKTEEAAP